MQKQTINSSRKLDIERQNYMRELAKLKVKYSAIFAEIAKEARSEQITAIYH